MKRTTVLLEEAKLKRLRARARRRGTTVTEEVREAVDQVLESEPEDTNQWLLELARKMETLGPPRPGPRVDIDSPEGKLQAARDIYRRKMNREPDF